MSGCQLAVYALLWTRSPDFLFSLEKRLAQCVRETSLCLHVGESVSGSTFLLFIFSFSLSFSSPPKMLLLSYHQLIPGLELERKEENS